MTSYPREPGNILECLFPNGAKDYAKYLSYLFTSVLNGADEVALSDTAAYKLWGQRTLTNMEYFDL